MQIMWLGEYCNYRTFHSHIEYIYLYPDFHETALINLQLLFNPQIYYIYCNNN